jgi:hypothetical protein
MNIRNQLIGHLAALPVLFGDAKTKRGKESVKNNKSNNILIN